MMRRRENGNRRPGDWKIKFACWLAVLAAVLCMGCGSGMDVEDFVAESPETISSVEESSSLEESLSEESSSEESSAEESSSEASLSEELSSETELPSEEVSSSVQEPTTVEAVIAEDGSYTSKEDVALYLETYDKLPGNFITKKEAQALGWEGGSLEPYAPGKCIGGDKFGNYEKLLPEADGRTYKECDIDTLGAKSRGAKRIVYSSDGLIYYTEDHYASFELLYD